MAWLITILCSCPHRCARHQPAVFTYACPELVEGTATSLRCATGADGQMVKVVFNANSANPSTTVYVSGSYQIADGVVTKYYEGGAFRVGTTLYYGLSDHIGSTSLTVSDNGTKFAEMR